MFTQCLPQHKNNLMPIRTPYSISDLYLPVQASKNTICLIWLLIQLHYRKTRLSLSYWHSAVLWKATPKYVYNILPFAPESVFKTTQTCVLIIIRQLFSPLDIKDMTYCDLLLSIVYKMIVLQQYQYASDYFHNAFKDVFLLRNNACSSLSAPKRLSNLLWMWLPWRRLGQWKMMFWNFVQVIILPSLFSIQFTNLCVFTSH